MDVNYPPTAIKNLCDEIQNKIDFAIELGKVVKVKNEMFDLYSRVRSQVNQLQDTLEDTNFSMVYAAKLARSLDKLIGNRFPNGFGITGEGKRHKITVEIENIHSTKIQQENREPEIIAGLDLFKHTFDFFKKINFLNTDLVIVGANGSGKTFLCDYLKSHTKEHGVIISSQRVLNLPIFNSINSLDITFSELRKLQNSSNRKPGGKSLGIPDQDKTFETVVKHMLAEDLVAQKKYRQVAMDNSRKGLPIDPPEPTNLQITLEIWNSLFPSRRIANERGMNIEAHTGTATYPVTEMSDGEKVAIFLIAQVMHVPDNGIVIVDEPEMYLHPTIHKRLWDSLEMQRTDCVFIYLTHSLDFAASRTRAKKLWLRSFSFPSDFTIEEIPTSELPKTLLMELLGSSQTILFCEGASGSLDEKIYTLLFNNFLVKPVGGCSNVIHFTKAFNKIPNTTSSALGIVDADYQSEDRLRKLEPEQIYGIRLGEVENLLLDEAVIKEMCRELGRPLEKLFEVKEAVLKQLQKDKALQVANFVSTKVDHFLKDRNFVRANDIEKLAENLNEFLGGISIKEWAEARGEEIERVIAQKDYGKAIMLLNNKGMRKVVASILGTRNFDELAIELIKIRPHLRDALRKHFPRLLDS